jgi:uncharacterized protein (TIGR03437 family)
MKRKYWVWTLAIAASLLATAWGATFGTVVAIGGHASDLALDEGRGVLYIANFTANRIDVMSLSDFTIQRSINVPSQPTSLSLSPDGKYLVIAHFGAFAAPQAPSNALTVITLDTNSRQVFAMGSAPYGVAFGLDGLALVATATDFELLDPVLGTTVTVDTFANILQRTLPQPPASFPLQITGASIAASRDLTKIYGLTDTIRFGYDVLSKTIAVDAYVAAPPLGPRVVSVSQDGSTYTAGWGLFQGSSVFQGAFGLISEFTNPNGALNIGSTAIDSSRGLIYAQIPPQGATGAANATPQTMQIVDANNLAVKDVIQLPENLAGKSIFSSDYNTLYTVSDSGVLVMPVGSLSKTHRVVASQADVIFRGNICNQQTASQVITISDLGGGNTDFALNTNTPGITISPAAGVTPAQVKITVDPAAFQNQKGTTIGVINIASGGSINLPKSFRVIVNNRDPDQRGTFVDIPGRLVDLVADPVRNRFYIVRQDTNEVLVFDGTTNTQIASLPTGNTPTQIALTFDNKYLLVGGNDTQILSQYDLDSLQYVAGIRMPGGHYPRSIASSARGILVANRVAGPIHVIDKVDLVSRTATTLPSLGVYNNNIHIGTMLVAAPNGSTVLGVEPDGNVLLYDANQDTFTISRKNATPLSGAYAASNFRQYVVGSQLLNASLVPSQQLETGTGLSSGFAFVDQLGLRSNAPNSSSPGIIERVDLQAGKASGTTRLVEAPVLNDAATGANTASVGSELVFTRTVAPLASRNAIIALTVSGFTVIPYTFDAGVAPPQISRVTNAADFTQPIAPGGLITVTGTNLSPITQSATGSLPTSLGDSCLQVNGLSVPILYVSSTQINAQLPNIDGNTTLRLATQGGVSDNFNLTILPAAPSVFRIATTQTDSGTTPSIVRSDNNQLVTPSNPVHRGDVLVIYATGLGRTNPLIPAGQPAPTDQLASTQIPVVVTLGGIQQQVLFAGLAPGLVGVYQINVQITRSVPEGLSVPLVISQGGGSTSFVVRVVN